MSRFKLATMRVSVRRFGVVLIVGLALCGARTPVHATVIDGTFSGFITRIFDGYNFYGPTPSDLVGTTVTGTFTYDTSSFTGGQCDGFNGPNLLCFNQSILAASVSITINGQTVTVSQSSDVSAISNGNFAIGDNVVGVVPGFPNTSGDYFSLNTFSPFFVGSVIYSPGPGVDFINGIDAAQPFSSNAPSFTPSESHLGGGAIVDYTITNIRTTVSHVPEPATLALLALGLVGLGYNRRKKA